MSVPQHLGWCICAGVTCWQRPLTEINLEYLGFFFTCWCNSTVSTNIVNLYFSHADWQMCGGEGGRERCTWAAAVLKKKMSGLQFDGGSPLILEAWKWRGLAEPIQWGIFSYTFKSTHFYQQIYVVWIRFFHITDKFLSQKLKYLTDNDSYQNSIYFSLLTIRVTKNKIVKFWNLGPRRQFAILKDHSVIKSVKLCKWTSGQRTQHHWAIVMILIEMRDKQLSPWPKDPPKIK